MTRLVAVALLTGCVSLGPACAALPGSAQDGLSALVSPIETGRGLKVFATAAMLALAIEALRNGRGKSSQTQR